MRQGSCRQISRVSKEMNPTYRGALVGGNINIYFWQLHFEEAVSKRGSVSSAG